MSYKQAGNRTPTSRPPSRTGGNAYDDKGQHDRAIEDYDQAIRLQPNFPNALGNRGRAKFYLARWVDAAADFQKSLSLNSSDAYTTLWLHLARKRAGQDDTPDFAQQAGRTDSTKWPASITDLFLGRVIPAQTLAAARPDSDKEKGQRCEAEFFVGEYLLLQRDTASALTHFREARGICPITFIESEAASVELRRLGADSTVPR